MAKKPKKKGASKKGKGKAQPPTNPYGLNPQHWLFCQEMIVDENATQAAIRAGYSAKTATKQASRLLTNVDIQTALKALRAARDERLQFKADDVVRRWIHIADADPNELIEMRRACCRHCHGKQFGYQRTAGEMKAAQAGWENAKKNAEAGVTVAPFDPMGGEGYDARKPAHPNCPECFGDGVAFPFTKDTRHLSPGARRLYAGVKITKDGIEIKMRDQDAALLNLAKHLGMFVQKVEVSGKDGKPIEMIEIVRPAPKAE